MRPKVTNLLFLLILGSSFLNAQTVETGDLAIISSSGINGEYFSIITLQDLPDTDIRFGNLYDVENNDRTMIWSPGQPIQAGTVVSFSDVESSPSVTIGTVTNTMNASGIILVFTNNQDGSATELITWYGENEDMLSDSSIVASYGFSLKQGVNGIVVGAGTAGITSYSAKYIGHRHGLKSNLLAKLYDRSNWTLTSYYETELNMPPVCQAPFFILNEQQPNWDIGWNSLSYFLTEFASKNIATNTSVVGTTRKDNTMIDTSFYMHDKKRSWEEPADNIKWLWIYHLFL